MEQFSLRTLARPLCCRTAPTWWEQHDLPVLLFVPTAPVLSYYAVFVLDGSDNDNPGLRIVALTEYVSLTAVMFITSAKDRACAIYYTYSPRFDPLAGRLLFRLPLRTPIALKYFSLYKFAHLMGTNPVPTPIAFQRCSEVGWRKTAVRDGFALYDLRTGEVHGLEGNAIPPAKWIRGDGGAPSSILLTVMPCFYVKVWS